MPVSSDLEMKRKKKRVSKILMSKMWKRKEIARLAIFILSDFFGGDCGM